ncbi:MAG: putative peptidoglycan binding domain protein [Geminicoccaceae bacterium]|nr:putative peptidoglycan binding domain protein [Geminicoccaceae bacterium]
MTPSPPGRCVLGRVVAVILLLASVLLSGGGLAAATLGEALARLLASGTVAASERNEHDLALLSRFYQEREMAPLWVTSGGVSARGAALAAALQRVDGDGLDPEQYGAGKVARLLAPREPERLAELELRLSLALLDVSADLAAGRLEPSAVDPELFLHPEEVERARVIRDAAAAADISAFVAGFRPAQDEYRRLRAALADLRATAAAGGWPTVPEGPTLDPGMRDPRVGRLRARLHASGDLAAGPDAAAPGRDPDLYDAALRPGVERFQRRHGLEPDGRVGARTLAALNVPAASRIRQVLLNLERRRWMPDRLGERYVFVNLADFHAKVVEGARTVFDTRVVVGARYHRTPVFSAKMTYVVINPYWHVPPGIARNELLPKIREDPRYLAANDFELLSDWSESATLLDPLAIDWSAVSAQAFPYKLREKPGPGNALGRIKFMFPNRFNVYMHDTPARALFEKTVRSFSHGCIRVERPEEFGAVVLGRQPGWSLDRIQAAIARGERRIVTLGAPLPVHITYLTAWVNKDGSVHFRDDVYGRDALLADALLGASPTD